MPAQAVHHARGRPGAADGLAVAGGAVILLLALAAVAGRGGRTAGAAGLSLPGALLAAGAFVVLAILVAFVPGVALGPTELLR